MTNFLASLICAFAAGMNAADGRSAVVVLLLTLMAFNGLIAIKRSFEA